jgi:hypothetical protein
MVRSSGPSAIAAAASQARRARTGRLAGFEPYGTPILRPWACGSVLEPSQGDDQARGGVVDVGEGEGDEARRRGQRDRRQTPKTSRAGKPNHVSRYAARVRTISRLLR